MSCKSCHSQYQTLFPSEICIHFPSDLKTIDKQSVIVFPRLLVCLHCGFTECIIPQAELRLLVQGVDDTRSLEGERGTSAPASD
jgi:hypothetical protein